MHPIKGYGPSLSDQGYGPEDAPLVSGVTNCTGCQIDYDRETGAATISYCADHDGEELDRVIVDAQELSAQAQRLQQENARLRDALLAAEERARQIREQAQENAAAVARLREAVRRLTRHSGT